MAHQIDESKPKYLSQTRFMSGRRIIKTSVTEITDENVVDVLRKALATHELNRSEIDYLWKYYRGDQPSDTGSAVLLRDGWSDAEARAKDSENVFKRAEKKMLKLVLRICRDLGGLTLKLSDIDMKFTRRNYEAIQSKSQVLISMLQEPKIHPQLAFQHSGMFSDAESAYNMSMKYYEEQQEKAAELAKKTTPDDSGDDDNDPDNNDI